MTTRFSFALPSVSLGAGSYFLALHSESKELMSLAGAATPVGFDSTTARFAKTGTDWNRRANSLVISLSDDQVVAVPEPESWAMMLVGLNFVGAVGRHGRRRGTVALRWRALLDKIF